MSPPFIIAVSPYHLTTREVPALAALQLADSVVTLLPAPASGRTREDVRRAVSKSPRYLGLMESWRWTMPLWRAGVVDSSHDDVEVADDLRASYERIGEKAEYAGLRPLTRHAAAANPDQFLDLLSADILKGGPDPGLNIPVSATIDDFASRYGLVAARSAAASIAQRAESKIGRRIFAIAVPVLTHASSRLILRMRDELAVELGHLRAALQAVCALAEGGSVSSVAPGAAEQASLARAVQGYVAGFGALRARLAGRDDDEGKRIISGYVAITGLLLPADVAIRSGIVAARAMNMAGMGGTSRQTSGEPGERAASAAGSLVVLVIKPLMAEPDAVTG